MFKFSQKVEKAFEKDFTSASELLVQFTAMLFLRTNQKANIDPKPYLLVPSNLIPKRRPRIGKLTLLTSDSDNYF